MPGFLLVLAGCSGSDTPISGAASTAAAPVVDTGPAAKGQVLVVLSSAQEIPLRNGRTYRTGYYLNELMTHVEVIIQAGYEPVFANPQGNSVTADEHSLSADYFGKDTSRYHRILQLRESLTQLQHPRRLSDVAQNEVLLNK